MLGLYIHVPFCIKKCRYCDFYSLEYSPETVDGYIDAVIRNIKKYSEKYDTVYFGGGTPSLLSPDQIFSVLSAADISQNAEISMECNPKTADIKKFSDLRAAGINRLSVGIQSFNDRELSAAGRIHSSADAISAIKEAYSAGIENISADIMLGLPYQTESTLSDTLKTAVSLPLEHISAYMLKVEESTPLAHDGQLLSNIADEDMLADMYLMTNAVLEAHGFMRYEISNFAQKGYECAHNLKYWHCEDYLGIGPSAHSCYNGKRFAVPKSLSDFITSEHQTEDMTDHDPCTENEKIMLGLRLREGISVQSYSEPEKLLKRAAPLEKGGFITINDGIISLTAEGCLVSNEIICRLT
ncbi:MAG: radical SAM family heme chaperone HemW [Oscillospiraceae bacterium]|nr:radical SAM family heme chaperone HemW [Oscillospiraceae bacterium]